MIVTIKYKGVELEVEGTYNPYDAGDYWTPPSGGDFEIENVTLEGVDVFLLIEHDIDEIERLCLKEIDKYDLYDF